MPKVCMIDALARYDSEGPQADVESSSSHPEFDVDQNTSEFYFTSFEAAKEWSMKSIDNGFTRSADGFGFVPILPLATEQKTETEKYIYNSAPPYEGKAGKKYLTKNLTRHEVESLISKAEMIELDKQIRPGDEYWAYDSPGRDWEYLAGQSGVKLIRDDESVYAIIIWMN